MNIKKEKVWAINPELTRRAAQISVLTKSEDLKILNLSETQFSIIITGKVIPTSRIAKR